MRSQNFFLLGICILVSSTLGYFVFLRGGQKSMLERLGAPFVSSQPTNALREDPQPIEVKKKEMPPPRVRMASIRHEEPAPMPIPAVPLPAVKPAAPTGPQPEATDIRAGTERNALLTRFPAPSLHTSTIKDGDLIELIVYHRDDQRNATFAQLQNGVVTRVYAGVPLRTLPH
ncbi:MAG: hypothetical protein HYX27_06165 [Acidobacteria bacterium]|nr:hypothetical protein [Acidobacteriota bacterium]